GDLRYSGAINFACRYAGHFFDGGNPIPHLPPAILPQRQHSLLDCLVANDARVHSLDAHVADRVPRDHQLEDPLSATIARLPASPATRTLPELQLGAVMGK